MGKYIIKRLLYMIPVLIGVIIIVFSILYFTPGDPAKMVLGMTATEEQLAQYRAEIGIDKPYLIQLFNYFKNLIIHGTLGISYITKQSVTGEIMARFPATLKLAVLSTLIAVVVGVITGIVSAIRQYSVFDTLAQIVGLAGVSMPSFWLAMLLIIVFCLHWQIFPPSGTETWKSWVLPSIALGFASAAQIMRMTRSSMLDVIRMDYIRTARAKGLSEFKVITRHALKNALIPIVTIIGIQLGGVLGGAVTIETVFSIAGIGTLSVNAISQRNMPVVLGGVLIIALSFSIVNLLVDILYAFIDPRIRSQYSAQKPHGTDRKAARTEKTAKESAET